MQKPKQELMKTTNICKTKSNETKVWFRFPCCSLARKRIKPVLQLSGPPTWGSLQKKNLCVAWTQSHLYDNDMTDWNNNSHHTVTSCRIWRAKKTRVRQLMKTTSTCKTSNASNPHHSLYQILPPLRPNQYSLRKRGHPFQLPIINTTLLKSTFINRCLFQFV